MKGTVVDMLSELRAGSRVVPLPLLLARLGAWKWHRMRRTRPIVPVHDRSRMRLDAQPGEHGIRASIFLYREAYEPSVRHAIDAYVRPGSLCCDIGANLGLWTLRMAERCGVNGHVLAFEPVAGLAAAVAEFATLSRLDNVTVIPVALSDREGVVPFYTPDDVGRGSLAPETSADAVDTVQTRCLDAVWFERGRPPVSFIKIDVEGAEPLVLRGAAELIVTARPIVCCELNPGKLANLGFHVDDITSIFAGAGYHRMEWNAARQRLDRCDGAAADDRVHDAVFLPPQ